MNILRTISFHSARLIYTTVNQTISLVITFSGQIEIANQSLPGFITAMHPGRD